MKNELEPKLVEVIGQLQGAVMKASDFAIQQLPDVVQSYILYGRVNNLFTLVFELALLYGCWRLYKLPVEEISYGDDEVAAILKTMFSGTVGVATLILMPFTVQETVLVWAAPKIWLIKELGKLIS